jgi:glycosyltransferase involved in cell wall biosynthesis
MLVKQQTRVGQRLPVLIRNVQSTRTWRPRDMINWHRMVSPLRDQVFGGASFDFYHLVYDICTSFDVRYTPAEDAHAGPFFTAGREILGETRTLGLFVDALDHTSGVATTIGHWARAAARQGHALRVYHCDSRRVLDGGFRFPPAGTLDVGVYRGLRLNMPLVSDVLKHLRYCPPDAVHISTPGPMGMVGLVAARELGLPVFGTYHTDFPAYAHSLTGSYELEQSAWNFMRRFYGALDRVAVPSASIRDRLVEHGFRPDRLTVVGRGIRPECFGPRFRSEDLRRSWNPRVRQWLLYVGRVSLEKNLRCLAEAYRRIHAWNPQIGLVVVGDGPYRTDMEAGLEGLPVVFTGILKGADLARAYASCDLFVFPSLTDTLGVVLLEAQASGLPVLVSAEGGPKDCMLPGRTGYVVNPMNPTLLARAASSVLCQISGSRAWSDAALEYARTATIERSFEQFWNLHFKPAAAGARGGRQGSEA